MWMKSLSDLEHMADKVGAERQSPVFVFENGQQLSTPHATHAEIVKLGRGRCSHWGSGIYFSTTDNTDPNKNERRYEAFMADSTAPKP
jgi:pectate lyase